MLRSLGLHAPNALILSQRRPSRIDFNEETKKPAETHKEQGLLPEDAQLQEIAKEDLEPSLGVAGWSRWTGMPTWKRNIHWEPVFEILTLALEPLQHLGPLLVGRLLVARLVLPRMTTRA